MYILGLNEALGSSAVILKDGEILAGALEERFTRIKNCWGFPKQAIKYCLDYAGINTSKLDLVILSYIDPYPHFTTKRAEERPDLAPNFLKKLRDVAPRLEFRLPFLNYLTDTGRSFYYSFYQPLIQKKQLAEISGYLKIGQEKIFSINHHLCHAYTAYFANNTFSSEPTLVLTNDGAGDQLCASIYLVDNNKFILVEKTTHIHSLGLFYASITSFLGMKAHEDEYKVMGLAPYASNTKIDRIYEIFEKLLWVDDLVFNSSFPARHYGFYLKEKLVGFRFDHIASAAQKFLEDKLVEWVKNAVSKTRVRNVVCAGGVFLNVKANQEILKRTNINKIFFMPSPGDDTNAIGACYYGFIHHRPHETPLPLRSLNLGPDYSDNEIARVLKRYKKFKVTKPKQIEEAVAQLLAQGEIVARFTGRMEFGARALGNRSILADPRKRDVVERLNKMIKMRDFWMPFAPTILAEAANKYLVNSIPAPYMILAFETTELGKDDLAAAIHPYDKSVRPQILKREDNPEYYDLIKNFEKLTGVGAILNTSFNIHGEPIVASPTDALRVFQKTDLKYLQLNNYIINK